MRNSFTKILFLIFSLFIFPTTLFAYTPFFTHKDTGAPLKHTKSSLVWNVENGPLQDKAPVKNFAGPNPAATLANIRAFCAANLGRSPAERGGNEGGGGGCSLNPFLKEAKAADAISSNGDAVNLISEAWGRWKNQAKDFGNVNFIQTQPGPSLNDGGDVNICNFDQFVDFPSIQTTDDPRVCGCINPKPAGCTSECRNPIIFDTNGEITGALGGNPYTTLAITSLVYVKTNTIDQVTGFNMVINGTCVGAGRQGCDKTYDTEDLKAIITHEVGHALGLGHSQVSKPVCKNVQDRTVACNYDNKLRNKEAVVTMYPALFNSDQTEAALSLHRDDLIGYAHLYGNPDGQFCRVEGIAIHSSGDYFRCVEFVAREENDPKNAGSIGFVSGAEAPNDGGGVTNRCSNIKTESKCGQFKIRGLIPSRSYRLEAQKIDTSNTGSNIGPCVTPPSFTDVTYNPPLTMLWQCPGAGGVWNVGFPNFK